MRAVMCYSLMRLIFMLSCIEVAAPVVNPGALLGTGLDPCVWEVMGRLLSVVNNRFRSRAAATSSILATAVAGKPSESWRALRCQPCSA